TKFAACYFSCTTPFRGLQECQPTTIPRECTPITRIFDQILRLSQFNKHNFIVGKYMFGKS
ncbi:MAG: hypothetical protein QF393_12695, partial [Rhodospirillales bacterium]|nr:hypothetical protein [Rhodospirillales bacterium]